MKRVAALIAFILLVAAVALAAGTFMPGSWYAGLSKPAWTPPNWLFAPVWSVLYLLIAVAGFLVWDAGTSKAALLLWGIQLVLNGIWTPLMFGAHSIVAALVDITLLWGVIAAFIMISWRSGARVAAALFVPYLAWVSYAGALNFALWRLS